MSSKARKNLIETADLLEKTATTLVDVLSICALVAANIIAFAVESLVTGKPKRVKLPKRAARPRQSVQKTIIYRQVVPRTALVRNVEA